MDNRFVVYVVALYGFAVLGVVAALVILATAIKAAFS